MKQPGSLRLRLLLLAGISITLAVITSGLGIAYMFEQHVERRIAHELENYSQFIISKFEKTPDGKYRLMAKLNNPRFNLPYSGLYWQVNDVNGFVMSSRSLWETEINLDDIKNNELGINEYNIRGPNDVLLFSVIQKIWIEDKNHEGGEKPYWIIVALDHNEITNAVKDFSFELIISLITLIVVLFIAMWFQIFVGLSPLKKLQDQVTNIRKGKSKTVDNNQPTEVLPLVYELNKLLEKQDDDIKKAKTRAGNLAHGLKTPLTILSGESRSLKEVGQIEIADEIDNQIEIMKYHIELELTRARVQGKSLHNKSIYIKPLIDIIIKTMLMLPKGDEINWLNEVDGNLELQIDKDDASEVFGNLLDNARKWAKANVTVKSKQSGKIITLSFIDDGPGIPISEAERMFERGKRLDNKVQGSGIGLSIVKDIIDAYNGEVSYNGDNEIGFEIVLTFTKIY